MNNNHYKKKFTYTWRIKNYSLLVLKQQEYLSSPTFAIKELADAEWSVRLCEGMDIFYVPDRLNCYLYRESTGSEENITMDVKMSMVATNGHSYFVTDYEQVVLSKGWHYKFNRFKLARIKDDLGLFLGKDDVLTIRCEMWLSLKDDLRMNRCFACTYLNMERRCFTWDLDNIANSRSGEIFSLTQRLTLKELSEVRVYVNVTYDGKVQIEFVVERAKKCLFALCNVSLLDSFQKVLTTYKYKHQYGLVLGEHFEHWKIPLINLKEMMEENKMFDIKMEVGYLRCEFNITDGERIKTMEYVYQPEKSRRISSFNDDIEGLKRDLQILYDEKDHHDAVLRVKGQEFCIHKAIVCARSPVFKAMFDRDMEERKTNCVDIDDLEGDTINRMLKFMYTGLVDDISLDVSVRLYRAADKYEMMFLRDKCSEFLMSNLSLANICEILVLADLHHDEELGEVARCFVFGNSVDVFSSEEWTSFLDCETKIAAEIMREFLLRNL